MFNFKEYEYSMCENIYRKQLSSHVVKKISLKINYKAMGGGGRERESLAEIKTKKL